LWLCRNAEDGVDELSLRDRIALDDPSDLAFADGMHRLVAFDRSTPSTEPNPRLAVIRFSRKWLARFGRASSRKRVMRAF
jgi:hypothetical protein